MTLTVFADLGRAMALAFLLIYFVLVARFRSFRTPLIVLAAVPLAMIGIMPGFALLAPFGIYFSATAMIGLIALVGIVVRNSIILIEFIEDKLDARPQPSRRAGRRGHDAHAADLHDRRRRRAFVGRDRLRSGVERARVGARLRHELVGGALRARDPAALRALCVAARRGGRHVRKLYRARLA